jgi:hypothetical protein
MQNIMTLLHPVQNKQQDKSDIRNFHNILAQLSASAGTISKRHVIILNGFPILCIFTAGNYT